MNVRWYGQSAFTLTGSDHTVTIDPFGDLSATAGQRLRFDYPAVPAHDADLLLITHEHRDHNHAEVVTGEPYVVRSTAGTFATPVGEVIAIASEHDAQAGTARGPNTIFVFELDGARICHMGDFGQAGMRPEQRQAIGDVDVLFVPVGGGPTLDAAAAAEVVEALRPAVVVPMHYRTDAIDFLEPADAFLQRFDVWETPDRFDLDAGTRERPVAVSAERPR